MLWDALKILFGIIRKSKHLKPAILRYRIYKIRFSRLLRENPYYILIFMLPVLLFFLANPDYSPFLPAQKCGNVDMTRDNLSQSDGNQLKFIGERPCEPQTVQAIEFVNLSNVALAKNDPTTPAVSAGIFMTEKFRGVNNKSQWHEYTVFHRSNNFLWSPSNPDKDNQVQSEAFDKGECSNSRTFDHQDGETEIRDGVIIRSNNIRPDPSQGRKIWERCIWSVAGDARFNDCKYQILEFFLPVGTPEQTCPKKSIVAKWIGRGTEKSLLADPKSYDILVRLARDRWDKSRLAPVSDKDYKKLTSSLPKLCMRWVQIDGGKAGPWEEFATIPAVWCDL